MPKRSSKIFDRDIDYYRNKIKEIKDKERRKRRRIIIESSESDDNESMNIVQSPQTMSNSESSNNADESAPVPADAVSTMDQEHGGENDPELDIELLTALGDETKCTPKFGEKIHRSLAQRWEPILKKGLLKDIKDKLFKEYLIPENCTLLQAPKLNSEVAAAMSDTARMRDKRKETDQQQLGVGISSINNALTLMLTGDNKVEAIRILGDGCRILTDLHYQHTQSRIKVINYSLAKPFLNIVQDSERDDTLYGNTLAEKIKASKAIERQGLSIKKFVKSKSSPTEQATATTNTRSQYQYRPAGPYQGNWSSPSRFQQNRGGRRGTSRPSNLVTRLQSAKYAPIKAGSSKIKTPTHAARQ